MKNKDVRESIKNACAGFVTAFKDERNFRIEIIIAIGTLILSGLLKVSMTELTVIVFCIMIVLVAELINSALEHLVNLFSPELHEDAKKAKDIGAAAVLVMSLGAAVIGIIIFLPKIIHLLTQ